MDQSIQKMFVEMRLRGLSESTSDEYARHVKVFEKFCSKPLEETGEDDVKTFLHYLITEKKLAASSVNIYNAALKFFYQKTFKRAWNPENLPRTKRPKKIPKALSKEEVQLLFDATDNLKHKCVLMTVYGSGLTNMVM